MNMIKIPKIENVRMLDRFNENKHSIGSLFLTTTHLIFSENKKQIWMLHMHIQSVEKQALTTNGCPLVIRCKNFLSATFLIPIESHCHDIFVSLLQLSQPANIHELYCFHYAGQNEGQKGHGWDFFTLEAEFMRQGVPENLWTKTTLNRSYQLCDTYSRDLYVPAIVSDHQIRECARFRSKGRLPVLTYFDRRTGASITRCSQPLSGFSGKRSPEDEQMIESILKSNLNKDARFIYIVDTRPKVNAFAQRMAGKGFESEMFYENVKFQFFGIENIHVMRSSLNKMLEAAEMKTTNHGAFLAAFESSGWLKHIRCVLETAHFVARQVKSGVSVLVHCSDGWDRTAQTCALASLLLDPFYRTIRGFQALIEKDWLYFGHKFIDRCGILPGDSKEVAPIFTQFIESVWQLWVQHPTQFEFNERFLITIHDHVYSAQYGTFIGNCERERDSHDVKSSTYSLWGYLDSNVEAYLNPLHRPGSAKHSFLEPSLNPQSFRYWRGMYNRFEIGIHPREHTNDRLSSLTNHYASMKDHADFLEQRIAELTAEIGSTSAKSAKDENRSFGNNKLIISDTTDIDGGMDHPLALSDTAILNNINETCDIQPKEEAIEKTSAELKPLALEWASLRSNVDCPCSLPLDFISRKYHCWNCGRILCARCLDKQTHLFGHRSASKVTVCRTCFKELLSSRLDG